MARPIATLVLILVDAGFLTARKTYAPYDISESSILSYTLSLDDFRRHGGRHPFYRQVRSGLALAMLVRIHDKQSIFHHPVLPTRWSHEKARTVPKPDSAQVLVYFLLAAFWETECLRIRQDLQYVRSYAMREAGERSFSLLIAVRSHLGHVRNGISSTREAMSHDMRASAENGWFVQRQDNGYEHQNNPPREFKKRRKCGKYPAILAFSAGDKPSLFDWRDLPTLLSQLEDWIDVIGKVVNEEIQIAIGAVQVEDARVMKRQTERTVVLGALAAIYLPMTLVTGIFGMNISDITGTTTVPPDKWSVVNAWGIVFGATLGIILLYMALKLLLHGWRILRLISRKFSDRLFEDRWLRSAPTRFAIETLNDSKDLLMNMAVRAVLLRIRRVVQRVKELDLEAQKRD